MTAQETRIPETILYVPIVLVALTFCVFLMVQIKGLCLGTTSEAANLKRRISVADGQIALLKEHHDRIDRVIEEQKRQRVPSKAFLKRFADLSRDVKTLAHAGDRDAIKILEMMSPAW